MSELIEGLLSLAQLSRDPFRSEVVDLSDVSRQVEQAWREREVETYIQQNLLAHGDRRLLSAVMQNLLGNAWKFTSKQEVARIDIGKESGADGSTIYFVRDNGAGFETAHAEKLFDAFERLHSDSDFSGTGADWQP